MFRIGAFAHIAQVSTRLLRYYNQLGLLTPARYDPQTGYRYYSARQLPRLNRILALRELGLSLEQIGALLAEDVSAEALRGMLLRRKAEVTQALQAEALTLRQIESRIAQIDALGAVKDDDVVIKSVEERPFLALRRICRDMQDAVQLLGQVVRGGTAKIEPAKRQRLTVVAHTAFDDDRLDLELGFVMSGAVRRPLALAGELTLEPGLLPAVEQMATVVRSGPNYESHLALGTLGTWIESRGYEIAGPCREVFLDIPELDTAAGEAVVEIQYPVRRAA